MSRSWKFNLQTRLRAAITTLAIVLALTLIATQTVQAQTFNVIHHFTGSHDGAYPQAGLTIDQAGDLYGTTQYGGTLPGDSGYGVVFKLRYSGSGWVLSTLYELHGGYDAGNPRGRVAIAQDGTLYGTTYSGGGGSGDIGTVFHLRPSPAATKTVLAYWNETVINHFSGYRDGLHPQGDLTFDQSGNIYGTTIGGGKNGWGIVYELTPSGGAWTETVLYSPDCGGGCELTSGVVFDGSGSLYGVSLAGGSYGYGVVFQLTPSGSGWKAQIIHAFTGGSDGGSPLGGLIVDSSGNLYGTTTDGKMGGAGTVFELTPANGGWSFNTLYRFSGTFGPEDKLAMDAAGNLYGTTFQDGVYGKGSVFKLTPSNGGWTYTSLHDFTGGNDGFYPISTVVFDASGNLYGTAGFGGEHGYGVVWEITP